MNFPAIVATIIATGCNRRSGFSSKPEATPIQTENLPIVKIGAALVVIFGAAMAVYHFFV